LTQLELESEPLMLRKYFLSGPAIKNILPPSCD
jgi:hypothetical protein